MFREGGLVNGAQDSFGGEVWLGAALDDNTDSNLFAEGYFDDLTRSKLVGRFVGEKTFVAIEGFGGGDQIVVHRYILA